MKVPIVVTLVAELVLMLFSLHENVQSQAQFLTYENPDYDVSIQYPNDWTPSEDNLLRHQVVMFSAPEIEEKESTVSTIIYIPAELVVAVQPLYSPNMTTSQFVKQFLNEAYSSPSDYKIIESSNTTFAGMPAQKIIMYEYGDDSNSKVQRTIGIHNGHAYMIKYLAEPGQFDSYLPTAQAMIDSFQPSIRQQTTGVPQERLNEIVSNMTQDRNVTEPITASSVPQQEEDSILLQPQSSSTSDLLNLPKILLVRDEVTGDSRLPLRFSITNGIITDLTSSGSTKGDLNGWYPQVAFHFNEPSQIGLVNVKHVLTGPIKSYGSPDGILDDANYWENVPLNEQIVLEMNQPGLNYLVAAVQFANGTSGVYSAVMDVDVFFGSKSEEEDIMDFEMDEGTEYNILDKSEIENIQTDPGFQRAVSNIICSDLNDYGFQVCQQDRITSDTTTQQTSLKFY